MARGPVSRKDLAIETNYGYLNIYLSNLHLALEAKDEMDIAYYKNKVIMTRHQLIQLGYFERGKNNDGKKQKTTTN